MFLEVSCSSDNFLMGLMAVFLNIYIFISLNITFIWGKRYSFNPLQTDVSLNGMETCVVLWGVDEHLFDILYFCVSIKTYESGKCFFIVSN